MSDLREGDSGLGVPVPEKSEARALTEAEIEAYRDADEQELRRRLEELLEAADPGALGFRIPKPLRSLATLLILLAISVLLLLILGQASSLIANIKTMPRAAQWAMIGAGGLTGLLLLIVSIRLLALYIRVKSSDRIKVRVLNELASRGRLQSLATQKADECRKQLIDYLKHFPMDDRRGLSIAGLKEEDLAKLREKRAALMGAATGSPTDWLKRFQSEFQSILDEAAAKRAGAYATRAGIATAGSPNSFFDTLLVLYFSLAMIGDLVRIYNLRADGMSSMVVLGKVIGLAYLAGYVHEGAQAASDAVVETAMGEGSSTLARGVIGFISAKAAEGTANAFLMRRLGRATIRLLRPTHRD